MQFKVPQFLEIEDKIFGPFTFRQFVYLAGGAGICFILYRLLGIFAGAVPIIFVAGLSAALTFYRPNNKPFVHMLEAGFKYLAQDKLYVWKKYAEKRDRKASVVGADTLAHKSAGGERVNSSRLRDLAWSLDVLDLERKDNK